MRTLRLLAAAAAAALVLAAPSIAALPSSARVLMSHTVKLTPSRQLVLANRTVKHATDVLRFLKHNPMYGTPRSRMRVQHDHLWLLSFGKTEQRQAHARIEAAQRPSVDSCLDALLRREGGYNPEKWNGGYVGKWDPYSTHGGSGAYGGPQALPGDKMASAGADWATNIWTQIKWMKGYVMKYGGSCGALAHSNAYGWY